MTTENGNYILNNNINGTYNSENACIFISANNITFDCNDFTIDGLTNNNFGLYVEDLENITIKNCNIKNYGTSGSTIAGIYLKNTNNSLILDSNLSNNHRGIYLEESSNNTLTNNTVNSNNNGILIHANSYYNNLTNNTANSNNNGIEIRNSSNNTLTNNTVNSNTQRGIHLWLSSNNTLTNNTANSNNFFGIHLWLSSNNTLTNNTANSNTQRGIHLWLSSNNTITNNTANSNNNGIEIRNSSNNTITNNTANSNNNGILIHANSYYNNLTNNTANSNNNGIYLHSSNNTSLENNFLNYNGKGLKKLYSSITLFQSNFLNSNNIGIFLDSSSENDIIDNILKRNSDDILGDGENKNNTYIGNILYLNEKTSFLNLNTNKYGEITKSLFFNISINYPNGTTQNLSSINPVTLTHDFSFSYNNSTTNIFGNMTPDKIGIYSIKLNITDSNDNEVFYVQNFYSINSSQNFSTTVKYFLRPNMEPGHGQPAGSDAKSFLFSKPTKNETFICGIWIQASPDVPPILTNGNIQNITIFNYFKLNADTNNYIGVEKNTIKDMTVDINKTISNFPTDFTLNVTTFDNINWEMNNKYDWYNLSFKLVGLDPIWLSGPDHLSYVLIDYITNAPCPMMTNPTGLTLISSTFSPDNLKEAEIILDGEGTHELELKMPEISDEYEVRFDGVFCDTAECQFTYSGQYINITATFGSEHTIEIIGIEEDEEVTTTRRRFITSEQEETEIIWPYDEETLKASMKVGYTILFSLEGKNHTMELTELWTDFSRIKISSETFEVTVGIGETKEVDITGDGNEDINIYLEKIQSGVADFTFERLEAEKVIDVEVPEEIDVEIPEETEEIVGERETNWVLIISAFIIFCIILSLIYFNFYKIKN